MGHPSLPLTYDESRRGPSTTIPNAQFRPTRTLVERATPNTRRNTLTAVLSKTVPALRRPLSARHGMPLMIALT